MTHGNGCFTMIYVSFMYPRFMYHLCIIYVQCMYSGPFSKMAFVFPVRLQFATLNNRTVTKPKSMVEWILFLEPKKGSKGKIQSQSSDKLVVQSFWGVMGGAIMQWISYNIDWLKEISQCSSMKWHSKKKGNPPTFFLKVFPCPMHLHRGGSAEGPQSFHA